MEDPGDDDVSFVDGVDRRGFVRACMGAAAVSVGGASGYGVFRQIADLDDCTVRRVRYWGAKRSEKSPAPRGLALIPVRTTEEGFVAGVPDHLDWYRYCGHEMTPGLADVDHTSDDVFRYSLPQDRLDLADPQAEYWYRDLLGRPVHADDLRDRPFGTGAAVRWRSEGLRGNDVVTALVLKLDPERVSFDERDAFMDPRHHLMAFITFCTHFCCVPGYRDSNEAGRRGVWDQIFCTCHGSTFDPNDIRPYSFDLCLPRDQD